MNEYRELAKLFSQTAKTLETLAEIEDIKLMFGIDKNLSKKQKELLKEFESCIKEIEDFAKGGMIYG